PGVEQQNANTNKTTSAPIVTPKAKSQPVVEPEVTPSSEVVYWTPKGKSYHTTKSCPTLSRSKTILSGSQSESGKSDPCDRCHLKIRSTQINEYSFSQFNRYDNY
ncbi:MAG: hypothetical protein ACRCVJ_10385, partial [Clostridium sp.]